jgi:hypothetical protein
LIPPPGSESVLISEERNIARRVQAEGLEEGSRWFLASDTTGLLSHNVDTPEGLKKCRECSEKKTRY